jgi:transcriptional regulator with XRE-family HTH domain
MSSARPAVGELLRDWRRRRRMSQLALACEADISARHLSFLETGRARPSREMVVHLAEHLAVPLRDRNRLLLAAGYAPTYPERSFDDPALEAARDTVRLVLAGHEPAPAIAVDRH